jgi:hypothetical protein
MPIKNIGFWCYPGENHLDPHPADLHDPDWNPHHQSELIQYLENAPVLFAYLGYSYCRIDCGIGPREMGTRTLTDGVWAWPQGLSHYVSRHSVRLPDEFFVHAQETGFEPRWDFPDEPEFQLPGVDSTFWREWAFKQFPHAALDRIIEKYPVARTFSETPAT